MFTETTTITVYDLGRHIIVVQEYRWELALSGGAVMTGGHCDVCVI